MNNCSKQVISEMSPKKSPKKKVKTVLVLNDDESTKILADKSHEKQALKKSKELDKSNEWTKNFNEDSSTEEDVPLSPFKNKSLVADNYFMAQSIRSKTSKNSFAKLLQNFDLDEKSIQEIIDDHFAEERQCIIDSYVKDKSLDKWFRLLKY